MLEHYFTAPRDYVWGATVDWESMVWADTKQNTADCSPRHSLANQVKWRRTFPDVWSRHWNHER